MDFNLEEMLCKAVFKAWEDIKVMNVGPLSMSGDFPVCGQLIGQLLHVLIPHYVEQYSDGYYKRGVLKNEKDVHCPENEGLAFEIKTSSSKNGIFGNRSYNKTTTGKSKDSYYLAVNYEILTGGKLGNISKIRYGYVTSNEWNAQNSESGQQASLSKSANLKTLFQL